MLRDFSNCKMIFNDRCQFSKSVSAAFKPDVSILKIVALTAIVEVDLCVAGLAKSTYVTGNESANPDNYEVSMMGADVWNKFKEK